LRRLGCLPYDPRVKLWIESYLTEQSRLARSLPVVEIECWIRILEAARRRGAKIFVCGNGGSASNCSHFAVDLGKGASKNSDARFKVISLNENVSWMTALGNDLSFQDVFVEQLKNYGEKGDILLVVSVSGNSPNVIRAVEWAKAQEIQVLGLVGNNQGNQLAKLADRAISIPACHYGQVEDTQMNILHMICYAFIEGQVS
jgi:D-sedoheptulose 7-phosphate isomerase